MTRPTWDEYFIEITLAVAKRSTCNRAQVGAIIVKDKRILTTGYNGAPRGLPHCLENGCEIVDGHCVRTLHAEQNAIIQAALHGISVEGGTIYSTHQPCHTCAKMVINAGLTRVVYVGEYPDTIAMQYLKLARVQVDHFDWDGRTSAPPPSLKK
jgi:dCMP deaminase